MRRVLNGAIRAMMGHGAVVYLKGFEQCCDTTVMGVEIF